MSVKFCQNPACSLTYVSADLRSKYCSRSCAATVNNSKFPKRSPLTGQLIKSSRLSQPLLLTCKDLTCKSEFTTSNPKKQYCSETCRKRAQSERSNKRRRKECVEPDCFIEVSHNADRCSNCYETVRKNQTFLRIQSWLDGEWLGGTNIKLSHTIRNYLLDHANYCCSKCGFNIPHPDDNRTILEINHINGDGTDHRPENLEVLCPNCHALTSSYRGRNQGHGRPVSYLRIVK